MSQENMEQLRSGLASFLAGTNESAREEMLSRIAEGWDPEIELDASESPVLDTSGVYRGRDAVKRFWREWLALAEQFFALCEGPDSVLKARCTVPTTYPNAAQRKVFIQERLASLLLSTNARWRVKAADPFGFGWSMTRFRQFPHEAVVSDALKTAFLKTGFPEYMRAYSEIRARFAAGAQCA